MILPIVLVQEQIDELDVRLDRTRGDDQEDARTALQNRIDSLQSEISAMQATIPSEWEEENQRHVDLQKAELQTRNSYRRAADDGYAAVREAVDTLAGTSALRELGSAIPDMQTLMATNEPADMVDPLEELADQFSEIEGAGDIRSAVSKARSAMRKNNPDVDAAMESMDTALEQYNAEMQWREQAEPALLADLSAYEAVTKDTIGIRQQDRLSREQALSVASCSSHHRDLSLNF